MSNDNNRYKNGKIYTIRNINDNNLIYVGSTIQPLYKRFYEHKIKCMNEKSKEYNKILYKNIRETNNINDWYIELYENYPTENKELLLKREGEIIREIGTLNKVINNRTNKDYYKDNKEKINKKQKEYYNDNKEYKKEYKKEYYENNKDKINIKLFCSCGCEIGKKELKRHQRTNKHLKKSKEPEQEQEHNIIE